MIPSLSSVPFAAGLNPSPDTIKPIASPWKSCKQQWTDTMASAALKLKELKVTTQRGVLKSPEVTQNIQDKSIRRWEKSPPNVLSQKRLRTKLIFTQQS